MWSAMTRIGVWCEAGVWEVWDEMCCRVHVRVDGEVGRLRSDWVLGSLAYVGLLQRSSRVVTALVGVEHARVCGVRLSGGWFGQVMGRMVRHTELAEKWVEKVQRASHSTPAYELLEVLLQDAEQFLWAGHEMDSVGSSYDAQVRWSGRCVMV